jgi:hypothetical protein
VEEFLIAGSRKVTGLDLATEAKWKTFFHNLGSGFQNATCELEITNYKVVPTGQPGTDSYTIVLTRIDAATFGFNGKTLKFTPDRKFEFTGGGTFDEFRAEVANTLKPKKTRKARTKKASTKTAKKATKKSSTK